MRLTGTGELRVCWMAEKRRAERRREEKKKKLGEIGKLKGAASSFVVSLVVATCEPVGTDGGQRSLRLGAARSIVRFPMKQQQANSLRI